MMLISNDCFRRTSRRAALRIGGLGMLGVSLPQLLAAEQHANPHSPGDLAATIFSSLGLDPHAHIHDRDGRPFPLADGVPIEGVFA